MQNETNMGAVGLIPMRDIHADWEWNCRGGRLQAIRTTGLLQPVIVMPYPEWKENPNGYKYLLVMGYRRFRAHELLEYTSIRALVQTGIESERDAVMVNLTENMSRKQLDFKQEVNAVKRLLSLKMPLNEICQRLNVSYGWGQARYYAAKLPNIVTEEVNKGAVNITSTRRLYSIYKACKDRDGVEPAVQQLMQALKDLKKTKMTSNSKDALKKFEDTAPKMKLRSRKEIETMQDRILDLIGPCLGTRAMAWCAGVISSNDLEVDIKEECDVLQRIYIAPAEVARG